MSQDVLRLIVALVATALMVREALKAAPRSRRRLAFSLAAIGFGLLAVGNLLGVLAIGGTTAVVALVSLGVGSLLGSLVCLYLAFRAGEMNAQIQRLEQSVAEERVRERSSSLAQENREGDDANAQK